MNLAGIDLNLLKALDFLVYEQSVTRAGKRMGLSQPAMSHVLARLRDLLGDPVLVRTAQGMVPTPRALELVGPVRRGLAELDAALTAATPFEPSMAQFELTIAATDHSSPLLLPTVVSRLQSAAPGIDLTLVPWLGASTFAEVQAGRIDLAIAVGDVDDIPAGMYKRDLLADRFISLVRRAHPTVGDEVSLADYCALDHVLVSPGGGRDGLVDQILAPLGMSRRVAIVVPTFITAPFVVAASDMIVTMSEWVARPMAGLLDVRVVEPPVQVQGHHWFALWHERTHRDQRHRWFRDLLTDVARGLSPT